jgi:NtrC-family two-component system response regulator AlgB
MLQKGSILLVDDEEHILKTISICFDSLGFEVAAFSDPSIALQRISERDFDIAFLDLKMYPIDGIQLLEEIKKKSPDTTVVIITAHGSIDTAVEAIKKGAYDYLQKPFGLSELQHFIEKVYEHHILQGQVRQLRNQLEEINARETVITHNAKMLGVLNLARQVADSSISVLIEGESGTGKELLAQLIHNQSSRREKPFLKVTCAALPENLLESELFGHVKGAFTGAVKDRQGRFELADGGTVFLDEIAEVSPNIQVKLLKFLQSREFERLGDSRTLKVDVRVVAATNRDLDEALKGGLLRDDLYYRLNAVKIKLPPLRERSEDIPLLMKHFLRKFGREKEIEVSTEVFRLLTSYSWPGNVRELENTIERAVLLSQSGKIETHHLPDEIRKLESVPARHRSLQDIEREYIARVIGESKDLDEAAQILQIDPATLWRKRKKYNL